MELHLDEAVPAIDGLLDKAPRRSAHRRKRPCRPPPDMMLRQDRSRDAWFTGPKAMDLILTMDDATNEIYSLFLVEEESTGSTFRILPEVFGRNGMPLSLYIDRRSHYFHADEAGGNVGRDHPTQVGRVLAYLSVAHIVGLLARGAGPVGTNVPDLAGPSGEGDGFGRDRDCRYRQCLIARHLYTGPQRTGRGECRTGGQ